jgi:putative ABC transport system permease protein
MGLDPLLDRGVRDGFFTGSFIEQATRREGLSFFTSERAVLIDSRLSEQLGLQAGDWMETNRGTLEVVGTFSNPMGEPLLLMDIGHIQELFGLRGNIDRVDLVVTDEEGFRSRFNTGFIIQSGTQRRSSLNEMLRAFRLNLEALSLLALFVGVYLVYNTAMFAVVSRRRDAGILRALGAGRSEIAFAFLAEIILLGSAGGFLGGILGYFLSYFFANLIGRTITNLYFSFSAPLPSWSWSILLYGLVLGSGASLLGGIFPLVELVRVNPVRAMQGFLSHRGKTGTVIKLGVGGSVILLVSVALFAVSSTHVYLGFAGAFLLLVGASFLTGLVVVVLAPSAYSIFHRLGGIAGKIAVGNIRQNLGRTAVAIAAFMVALSMLIGLGAMIGSFRMSLTYWMKSQLRGDLYIAPVAEITVPEDFYQELQSLEGIAGIDTYRNVQINYKGTTIHLAMVDASVLQLFSQFLWLNGGNENWESVKRGEVIASESFYNRFGLGTGDTIMLEGVDGSVALTIAAVFYDYTTEHGLIMMDRSTYLKLYGDHTIDSLGIFLAENANRPMVIDTIRQKAQARGLPLFYQEELHGRILDIFDTTFAVTRSMRLLAIIVAFFGIAGAIVTLFMERQREFGIYRSLGFSTFQVAGMTVMEGLFMGLVSFFLCTLVGTALAWVLIKVINFHSFHWTIFYYPVARPYLVAGVTALLASLGATVYPIVKICRTYPQMQIREE